MKQQQEIIDRTIAFVKNELRGAEGGHDWFHIERVWRNAKKIASTEKSDLFVVELGALLHDIADAKFHNGDENVGARKAGDFLRSLKVDENIVEQVGAIVKNISFKGGNGAVPGRTIELDIVQDADRLDALGAIGVARAFNFGGFKNRSLYDPSVKPDLGMNPETYRKASAPTINHFYEKLLLLKDLMNTASGRSMAEQRHEFMQLYLEQFYAEWEGRR